MNAHFNLTINELPKTKKMQVDERHPLLNLQQNVTYRFNDRNSQWMKRKISSKLEHFMEVPCQ